jgi:hypothetical protein
MQKIWIVSAALMSSAIAVTACGNGDDTATPAPIADSGAPVDASISHDGAADGAAIDAADAGPAARAIFVGTDFVNAELSVVSLKPDAVVGHLPLDDEDSVAYASGGTGFVLERGLGHAIVLDPAHPSMPALTLDLNDTPDAGAYASNPQAVLLTTGTKAYAARYASNVVLIVDVATGAVTGRIDLSSFVAPDDPDGLVDMQDAVYDPTAKRAYFLLQRINQGDFSGSDPDNLGMCLASAAEIVGVDTTTDAIVDLNGAAPGQAIDLLGDDPQSLTADFADGRIIVPDTGCYVAPDGGLDAGPEVRVGRGIESVAIATGTPSWLYQTTAPDRLNGLLWVDGTHAFVDVGDGWFVWNPTVPSLGVLAAGFPQAPLSDGSGRVVGLSFAMPDAGSDAGVSWSVVAWDVATSQITTLVDNPFATVVPATSFGVTGALVR